MEDKNIVYLMFIIVIGLLSFCIYILHSNKNTENKIDSIDLKVSNIQRTLNRLNLEGIVIEE